MEYDQKQGRSEGISLLVRGHMPKIQVCGRRFREVYRWKGECVSTMK